MSKICKVCKIDKELSLYWKNKRYKDEKEPSCIECYKLANDKKKESLKEAQLKWKEKNPDYSKTYGKSEKSKEYHKQYYKTNSDIYIKRKQEWRKNNPIKEIQARQLYAKNNKEQINLYHRNWKKQKRLTDINYLIKENVSRRIRYELNTLLKGEKTRCTLEYLGCSIEHLKYYLEGKFEIGMNWKNYGLIWHIDHIIPCSSWNFNNLFDNLCCWNYRNLQPMWALQNKSKGDIFSETKKENYVQKMKFLLC